MLIEATTSSFDAKKLGNLTRRANELRRALRAQGLKVSEQFLSPRSRRIEARTMQGYNVPPLCVVPLMIASIPCADILPAVLKDAHTSHVVVLAREDLQYFLELSDVDQEYEETIGSIIAGRIEFSLA